MDRVSSRWPHLRVAAWDNNGHEVVRLVLERDGRMVLFPPADVDSPFLHPDDPCAFRDVSRAHLYAFQHAGEMNSWEERLRVSKDGNK